MNKEIDLSKYQIRTDLALDDIDKKVKLICCTQEKFFNALRSKLNWRGEPYA